MIFTLLLGRSNMIPGDQYELARAFTRSIEFNYISWELNSIWSKLSQWALGTDNYLSNDSSKQTTLDYLKLLGQIEQDQSQLYEIYTDPSIADPKLASQNLRAEIKKLNDRRADLEPLAESILQNQVSTVIADMGLTLEGQPIPPVLYRISPPPDSLVVSRRDVIQEVFDISVSPGLSVDQQQELEDKVDKTINVSSLVVGIGGIGLYPTMVMETTDLNWLANTVSHEWTHNYLTLHPLGASYEASPDLRTINETTASIAGDEIGQEVMQRFYPELAPPPPPPTPPPEKATPTPEPTPSPGPPPFNFNKEMHDTRVNVDRLLSEGKIDEAEAYMETRRVFMWDNGYHIRKLNQAFFAFYGAYADVPGGAAGEDPVGAAVRALRAKSATLADFLKRIAWVTSYQQLETLVKSVKP